MYQVLARKWRPQNFDELVGQQHVSRTLSNAIEADRLAHAYIFAGLRGTGKTTVARILAKCLNCESGPTAKPCGTCDSCTEIADSRAIDVLEIDAASRTKVEQTRELLEVVSYAPVRDRNKILIIDEAHMLSKASFNALLKTLEEPPPNVLFLLATTELQKILPTILSRCQVFEFRRVGVAELSAHLRRVCDAEGATISDAALERVARAGEGSVRDSLSVLERVFAFCGLEVDDEQLLRMLGAVRLELLSELVRGLAARDAGAMLRVFDGLVDEGHDLVHFWSELISALRDLLMLRELPGAGELLARSEKEAEVLAAASEGLTREDLSRAFHLLAELEIGLRSSSQPRYLFEAALIRLASLGAVRPIEEVLGALASGTAPAAAAPAASKKKRAAEPLKPHRPAKPVDRPVASAPSAPSAPAATESAGAPEQSVASSLPTDVAGIAAAIREERPMVAAMLEQARELRLGGGELLIRLPPGMGAVQRQLEQATTARLLTDHASRIAGGDVVVRIEIGGETPSADPAPPTAAAPSRPEPIRQEEQKTDAEIPAAAETDPALLERARREPGVRSLLDTFGARVVDIRRSEGPTHEA